MMQGLGDGLAGTARRELELGVAQTALGPLPGGRGYSYLGSRPTSRLILLRSLMIGS